MLGCPGGEGRFGKVFDLEVDSQLRDSPSSLYCGWLCARRRAWAAGVALRWWDLLFGGDRREGPAGAGVRWVGSLVGGLVGSRGVMAGWGGFGGWGGRKWVGVLGGRLDSGGGSADGGDTGLLKLGLVGVMISRRGSQQ